MTPCARGCCWVPMAGVCASRRTCPCHWGDLAPKAELKTGDVKTYRNPTQDEAIRRVMAARNPKRPRI